MPERSFGRTVRYRRTKLGISQTRLAELVGRSPATVRSWEAERSVPKDPTVLQTLVAILGVDERILFDKAGVEPPASVETSPTVEQALATLAPLTDPDTPQVAAPKPKAIEELTAEVILEHDGEGKPTDPDSQPSEPVSQPRPSLRVVPRPKAAPVAPATTTTTMTPVVVRELSYIEDPAQRQFYQIRTLAAVVGLVALVVTFFWAFATGLDSLGAWWGDFFSNLRL